MEKEYNAADEDQLDLIQEQEKLDLLQKEEDLRKILDTPEGIRFFKEFFSRGKVFNSTFTGNSQTYFLEGRRSFALEYFADISEIYPEKIVDVMIVDKKVFDVKNNNNKR